MSEIVEEKVLSVGDKVFTLAAFSGPNVQTMHVVFGLPVSDIEGGNYVVKSFAEERLLPITKPSDAAPNVRHFMHENGKTSSYYFNIEDAMSEAATQNKQELL